MKSLFYLLLFLSLISCGSDDSVTDVNPDDDITSEESDDSSDDNGGADPDIIVTINDFCSNPDLIFNGNVILSSQEEVEEFGSNNYCAINGVLTIGFTGGDLLSDISNLSSLVSIQGVKRLDISNNGVLTTLNGLEGMKVVEREIRLQNNQQLEQIDALSNVVWVRNKIHVERNDSLLNIDGFSGIVSPLGELHIEENNSLLNIDGLLGLTKMEIREGAPFPPMFAIFIEYNQSLNDINGLGNLEYSYNTIRIGYNGITHVDGLSSLTIVDASLFLREENLASISGLSNLNYVGKILAIIESNFLKNLDDLSSIEILGGIMIVENPQLSDLNGLSQATFLDNSDISIGDNESLTDISGVNFPSMLRDLRISINPILTNFGNVGDVTTITRDFVFSKNINNNHLLTHLTNLTSIGGSLVIHQNETLENLDGLESLVELGSLYITYNPMLTDFCGLVNLFANDNVGIYEVTGNAYNPPPTFIIPDFCSI